MASVIYFDAYVHFEGDAVAFWKTLTPAQQDHADHLVRLVAHTLEPDPEWPSCPRGCDVATRPESLGRGRWCCTACGLEFTYPPVTSPVTPPVSRSAH